MSDSRLKALWSWPQIGRLLADRVAQRTTLGTWKVPVGPLAIWVCLACLSSLTGASQLAEAHSFVNPGARASRVLNIHEEAHLGLYGAPGSRLTERGNGKGTFKCRVEVSFVVSADTIEGTFTAYPPGGSISGHAVAQLTSPRGEFASFSGSVTNGHGTGRYRHASGNARIYGVINRINYGLTVQVIGRLHA